jgi:hypothetical protein
MDRVNRAIQGTNDLDRMMHDVLDVVLDVFGATVPGSPIPATRTLRHGAR